MTMAPENKRNRQRKVLKGRRKLGVRDGWLTAPCTRGTHCRCWSAQCACPCHKKEGALP